MTARQILDGGGLDAAVAEASAKVRAKPADPGLRTNLFELLCLAGDLDRAEKQLDALGQLSTDLMIASQRYRNALRGERGRRAFFERGVIPALPRQSSELANLQFEAASCFRQRSFDAARELLDRVSVESPSTLGTLDGKPVQDLTDSDELLGGFLEVITPENYCWLPFSDIQSILLRPPAHLRDLVWAPCFIELHKGPLGEVYLPALYCGSHAYPDDAVRLGLSTVWSEDGPVSRPMGQKVLADAEKDYPLLDIREITLQDPTSEEESDADNA